MGGNMRFPKRGWCLTYWPELNKGWRPYLHQVPHVRWRALWTSMTSAQHIARLQSYIACLLRWLLVDGYHTNSFLFSSLSWLPELLIFGVSTEMTASVAWTSSEVNCSAFLMSFLCWGPTQYCRWGSHDSRVGWKIASFDLLALILLMQPRIQIAFWAASSHCQLTFRFSATNSPKSSAELPSIHSSLSVYPWDCLNPGTGPYAWPC